MATYKVFIREVHVQEVWVDATSIQEAKEMVADGKGTYVDNGLVYSHCLDQDTWEVF